MITTITTTTISTVTGLYAMGIAGIVVAVLIAFLTVKELAGGTSSGLSRTIGRHLSVPILPMLMVFAAIVIIKITEVLA